MDLLLASSDARTPIACEVKIGDDKHGYYAFVQALTCLAHLASPNQYARLRKHFHGANFPDLEGPPRLDLYLLFVDKKTPHGEIQEAIAVAVSQLAARLLAFDGVATSIRRIVGLDVTGDASLTTTVRFAYQRDPTRVAVAE